MLKEKGQRLNALEQILITRGLTQGADEEECREVAGYISDADTITYGSRRSVPNTARYVYSANSYDYYVGDCDGYETALYICKD